MAEEQSYQNYSGPPQDAALSSTSRLIPPAFFYETLGDHQLPAGNQIGNMPTMNEEQAQEALIDFVAANCCYGKKPARDIIIRDIRNLSVFHYTLQSYGEKRTISSNHVPYGGGTLDTGQTPADIWSINVGLSKLFKNFKTTIRVPHSERVETCHGCIGTGRDRCTNCNGTGKIWCTFCAGRGSVRSHYRDGNDICSTCNGSGQPRCQSCSGNGHRTCSICIGRQELKYFLIMTIEWTNHFDDFTSDSANLPGELITRVKGMVAFEEQQPKVCPITDFPETSIVTASQNFVTKHASAFLPDEKVVQQRHRVRIIPVSEVQYTWNDSQGQFYVYGYENKVYFPDYPQKCCCGCTIL